LVIASKDGTNEKELAAGYMTSPAWSPDGNVIVCGFTEGEAKPPTSLLEVRVADRQRRLIGSAKLPTIQAVAWLPDSSGLMMAGQEESFSPVQLWHISYPKGVIRKITNDLNDYLSLSVTADSGAMVAVRSEQVSHLWIAPNGNADRAKQISPGLGKQDQVGGVCWTSDGKLVYESDEGGNPGVWISDADGGGRKQLSDSTSAAIRPSVTMDGRYIVFSSERSGDPNIWRMDSDGGNLKRLTSGTRDVMPYCSPDSRWVVYTSLSSPGTLWRVPIDGGDPVQLTSKWTRGAVHSPDGKLMVCWYRDEHEITRLKMAVVPSEGGDPINVFAFGRSARPPAPAPNYLRWTPDGSAVLYIDTRDGVSNIWSQPLDGGPPKRVTDFKTDRIFSFDWSKDGKQLALSRGTQTSDIVLLTGVK
jgi:Tol biopolymer transport system component